MYFNPFEPALSAEVARTAGLDRFADYSLACSGDTQSAVRLYAWNAALAGAFWSPIATAEIALRNAMATQLEATYGPTWYDDPNFLALNAHGALVRSVAEVKKRIGTRSIVTTALVVSQLSFGFWTSLLGKQYARTLWPKLKPAFPKYTRRATVSGLLDELRVFRNRIAHHQHIYDKSPKLVYENILKASGLLSDSLPAWIDHHNRVVQLMSDGPMRDPLRF